MATETPLEGDVGRRRRQAVVEKLLLRDLALRHRLGILGVCLLALVPLLAQPRELNQFTYVLYLMMFAISWDVVSGYTGQLSFGHAFFFALGGYGTSVTVNQHLLPLANDLGLTLGPVGTVLVILGGIVGGTLVAALGGVLIGVPALRLDGPYLSLVTLIAPLLLYQSLIIFSDEGSLPVLAPGGLGGTSGLLNTPPSFVGIGGLNTAVTVDQQWVGAVARYYISFLALLIVLAVTYGVTRSAAGSVFTAIREDEDAVRSVGMNPAKFKIFAFVLSAAIGGFAAAVWMHAGPNAAPNTENLFGSGRIDLSINVIVIAIIGGMGTIVGSIVGALFFAFADTVIGGLDVAIPGVELLFGSELTIADTSPLPTFLLGMLALVFLPRGVVPELTRFGRRLLAWRRGEVDTLLGRDRSPSTLKRTAEKYREEIEEIVGGESR
ncbi:branched-chain amino acid ABC transporter permease [Halobacteriales archaeon QS_8_69_73]|nr:MAG: branched-chain amino acid ABC transporter permease [Halobacteriales archaeon QS_8_69_73]